MMHTAYISVGSNLPDRCLRVARALRALRALGPATDSHTYETPCHNGLSGMYCNAVVRLQTTLSCEQLELTLKTLEEDMGRRRLPGDHRVAIDLDTVMYDNRVIRPRDRDRVHFTIGYDRLMNHPHFNTDPRLTDAATYTYDLPDGRIAKYPLADRDKCKLLVADSSGVKGDYIFSDLTRLLEAPQLLVYNNTRVINARLRMHKDTGAAVEIFCLEPVTPADYQLNFASAGPVEWKCFVGNSKRWKDGVVSMTLTTKSGRGVTLSATRVTKDDNNSVVRLQWDDPSMTFADVVERAGEIPIPPYLNRPTQDSDLQDYQTVFSHVKGSVAAPTAGLHFTDSLLESLEALGVERHEVTLHVGAGTFQPVKTATIGEHHMHAELIDVPTTFIRTLAHNRKPVTAVGTTTVRTLESLYHIGCAIYRGCWNGTLEQWFPYEDSHPQLTLQESMTTLLDYLESRGEDRLVANTRIIIVPGYIYRVIDNLITNFHQPGSTLLLLVGALIGDTWRSVYRHALDHGYRFLSYGDACLFKR